MYIVEHLSGPNVIRRVDLNGLSAINPDFEVMLGVHVKENGDVWFLLILHNEDDNEPWVEIPFSALLTDRHLPQFAVSADCFWKNSANFVKSKDIWPEAAEIAICRSMNPKVEFSRDDKNVVVEFSFGNFCATEKVPFAGVSKLLQ